MKLPVCTILLLVMTIGVFGQRNAAQQKITGNVMTFYKWYISTTKDQRYARYVRPVEGEFGMTKLETVFYFKQLDSLGIISNDFIKSELERFRPCADFLKTQNWATFSTSTDMPAEDQCGFLYYYYWTGGHEPYDGVRVTDVKVHKNLATAVANLFSSSNKAISKKSTVHLKRKRGKWLISEIEI